MNLDQGFDLKDVRGLVRRRAPLALATAGALLLLSIVVAAFLPNQYEAYTTLLIEPQSISKKLVEGGAEEGDLNNRLHLMTMTIFSRPRLSKVIDDLKLYPELSKTKTREEVIEYMRDHLRVEPVLPELEQGRVQHTRDTEINTFRLFFRHESAELSSAVANRLANDFIEEHIKERVQVSGDTSDFIENELTRLQSRIQEVEGKIAAVKAQNPGRLPEDLDAKQRLLEQAMMNLRGAQRDLAEAESDEAFYRQQALTAGLATPTLTDEANPARRLQVLEIQLGEARARGLTEKHPDVMAILQEIESLKQKVAATDGDGTSMSLPQQNAEAERRRAALRAESAKQEVGRISEQVQDVQNRINDTPRVAEDLAALDREYKHLYESYQDFSSKRLEAGVAANMERRQKGEQVRVLESAVPPPDPSSPNRLLIVAMGLVLGLGMGAGLAVLTENLDSSFHGPRDLQSALKIPVLAAVPAILLDADRQAQRRQRLRRTAATVVVTLFVLIGSAGGYLWVNGGGGSQGGAEPAEVAPAAGAAAPAGTPAAVPTPEPGAGKG